MAKKFPLSFSRLNTFEQCGTKFEHLYVNRTVQDTDNEFTLYGSRVHSALETYGKAKDGGGTEVAKDILSDGAVYNEVRSYLPLVDTLLAQKGTKYFEEKMAIAANKQRCDWFSPDVWLRGIADVLIIDGHKAFVGDWKTGKVKDSPLQLKMFAAMVFALYPEVTHVRTAFIWLATGEITDHRFTRDMLDDIWATLDPRLAAVQEAVDVGVFKSRPTPLCNWCAAKGICPDRKKR